MATATARWWWSYACRTRLEIAGMDQLSRFGSEGAVKVEVEVERVECGAMEAGRRSGDDGILESSSLATSTQVLDDSLHLQTWYFTHRRIALRTCEGFLTTSAKHFRFSPADRTIICVSRLDIWMCAGE